MAADDQIKKLLKENILLSHKLERIERSRMFLESRWDRNSNLFQKLHNELEEKNIKLKNAELALRNANEKLERVLDN